MPTCRTRKRRITSHLIGREGRWVKDHLGRARRVSAAVDAQVLVAPPA